MIPENLAGRRIAITGSTGFLGTALVERLLRSAPGCELVLILRPGRRGAGRRVERDILRNDAFDNLRSQLGTDGFAEMTSRRITAVAGDVTSDSLGLDADGLAALALDRRDGGGLEGLQPLDHLRDHLRHLLREVLVLARVRGDVEQAERLVARRPARDGGRRVRAF